MNSITIVGRIGKDAELKTVGENQVASFSLVMDHMIKGEKVPQWFDVSVWGNRARTAAQYLKKGGTVGVTGRLMPVYVSGEKAYLKVDASDFTLPPKASGGDGNDQPSPPPARRAPPPDLDDPIPF